MQVVRYSDFLAIFLCFQGRVRNNLAEITLFSKPVGFRNQGCGELWLLLPWGTEVRALCGVLLLRSAVSP